MEVEVLGPVQVRTAAGPVDLGTRKQRALVAALALFRSRPVSVDTLVDLLWGDSPPATAQGTLQGYVARLRRALDPGRTGRTSASTLATIGPGYALAIDPRRLDVACFEEAVAGVHRAVALLARPGSLPLAAERLSAAATELDVALRRWRGTPFAELGEAPVAVAERARLEELRLVAVEDRAVLELALGHHATVAADLERLTSEHPLRERLWALRALALTRSGRQADALDVLAQVRTVLDEELGLEPSAELRALQTAVLRQDPSLQWTPPPGAAAVSQAPAAAPAAGSPPTSPGWSPAWPMVGRTDELAALVALLDADTPSFAAVVGEPGIGKSRLVAELAARARARGVRVVLGRCSQDEGAPPLWPWAGVLAGLGHDLPDGETGAPDREDEGARFRAWHAVLSLLLADAHDEPLLVVLEDLHWADVSSLRVLRLLAETAESGRLLVVATWRDQPEPTGALGDVAESLARRHALRITLTGLDEEQVAGMLDAVTERRPSQRQAAELRERTDGNPFFLVEYARLAGDADLDALLAEPDPPAAVNDVLVRRLDRLPEQTGRVLRTAAVLGRRFRLDTVAVALGADEDDVLEHLEPSMEAGLVRDDGVDRFRFAHALVREALARGLSASRRARLHLRVAQALEATRGRETEIAQHWLAAGPAHAGRAWRAARAASDVTRRLHAHEETAALLEQALEAVANDPDAGPRDRYGLLMDLVDAYRWSGHWQGLTSTAEKAVAAARALDDQPELVAQAAVSATVGALWQSAPYGEVHEGIVGALRESLDRLPTADDPLRCRTMLGLANELYYGATFEERRALVEEALAMARRLDDPALLLDACQIAFVALWCPRTGEDRLRYVDEAVALAERIGDGRAYVVAATLRTVVANELGRVEEMWDWMACARSRAEEMRLPYGLLVLDNLEMPWRAMAGRFEECAQILERIQGFVAQMSLEQGEDAAAGAMLSLALWQGRSGELLEGLAAMAAETRLPLESTVLVWMLRAGMLEEARAYAADHPVRFDHDDWFSAFAWGNAAEASLALGDTAMASAAYAALAPYAGRTCCAGSAMPMGPVDAFLALAAAAVDEQELAGRHADRALALCEAWDVPLVEQWLRDQRSTYGF